MHKPKKRYTFCYKKSLKEKNIYIYYIGEMDQNKIDNLETNNSYINSANYLQKTKTTCQRRAQEKTRKNWQKEHN